MTYDEKLGLILEKVQVMKSNIQDLKQRVTHIELKLEKEITRDIQLLAENFSKELLRNKL